MIPLAQRLRPRITLTIMAPVVVLGLLILFLANYLLTPPLVRHLQERTDSELRLASELGLSICDGMLGDILDLRLEDSPQVNTAMRREALAQIQGLKRKFHSLELVVVDRQGRVLGSTLSLGSKSLQLPQNVRSQRAFTLVLAGRRMRAYRTYFPYWRWNILSLISEDDYLAPRRMASRVVIAATAAVLLVTLITLLIAFHLLVNRPLKRIIEASSLVGQGEFVRLPTRRRDEVGRVLQAFDSMVGSLEEMLQRLRESERQYRSLTENSLAYIAIIKDFRLVYVNPRLVEESGYSRQELLGMEFIRMVHPQDHALIMKLLQRQIKTPEVKPRYEFRGLTKDGQIRWIEVLISPIDFQGGPALLAHGIDITGRKEAEARQKRLQERLQHSQKMEVVGILAGGIAHDFNNVLQVISGYVQILLGADNLNPVQRTQLLGIQESADRASDLVNRLLTFGRRADTHKQAVDLNREVRQTCRMLERTIPRMISIEMELESRLQPIKADPTQLDQIIMNLGNNAKDAMPAGGRLIFKTANVTLDHEFCQGLKGCQPGDYVLLEVSDTGQGMDENTLAHIFDPFFTTKGVGEGTGLGLSTVYGIVQAHGGHITCQSRPKGGTTFRIYLPVMRDAEIQQAAPLPPPSPPAAQGRGETVLVVDDEADVLNILKEALERNGYHVLQARSGEEALEIFSGTNGVVDLVIMDLGMPGMGGRRCLEEMLRLDPEARIIVATGYSSHGQQESILQAGARGFVAKPYRLQHLLARIRQALDH